MMMNDIAVKLTDINMIISERFLVYFIMTYLTAYFDRFKIYYNT
jgi:hypothetical protein